MAKLTLAGLQTFVGTYVAAAKQAAVWTGTTDNLFGLLDKVGLQITLDGTFNDTLPELDGNDLPLGKTVEEWFVDLTLPVDYDSTGATTMAPHNPTFETVTYDYTLGRKVLQTTQKYDDVERAAIDPTASGQMIAKIMERLTDSYSLYTYNQKKQLMANLIAKAEAATNKATLVETLAIPTDDLTGEAFIKGVKKQVENASFANEGNNLGNYLIGRSPALTLFIKKGVMPSLEVDTIAGAFNANQLSLPATIKIVDDFGNDASNVYAILTDTRGIKLHRGYHAIRQQLNAQGDFMNFYDHSENTGFISKSTFVHCFKSA